VGYTHYWRVATDTDPAKLVEAGREMTKVIEASTLPLADGFGEPGTAPRIDLETGTVWFNGSTKTATKRSAGLPASIIPRATIRVRPSASARPRGSPTTTWSSPVYSLLSASSARRSKFHRTVESMTSSTRRRVGTSRRVRSIRGRSGSYPSCRHRSRETATRPCSTAASVGMGQRSGPRTPVTDEFAAPVDWCAAFDRVRRDKGLGCLARSCTTPSEPPTP
jgi:hypothetical protein